MLGIDWDAVAGCRAGGRRPVDLDGADVATVVSEARWRRMLGLLDGLLACGAVVASAELIGAVGEGALDRHRVTVEREAWNAAIVRRLARAGIDAGILKGSAWAHRYEVDPGWRQFADLDLLVPAAALADTQAILAELGFERRVPELAPGFDVEFSKGFTLERAGFEVDVHRTIAPPPFTALVDPEPLYDERDRFEIAGVPVWTPGPAASFVHAALHHGRAAHPRGVALRDIARIAMAGPDPARVHDIARRWRGRAGLQRILPVVAGRLGLPADLLAPFMPVSASLLERSLDRFSSGRTYRTGALVMTPFVSGIAPRIRYVRAHLAAARDGRQPTAAPHQWAPAPAPAPVVVVDRREPTARLARANGWVWRTSNAGAVGAHIDAPERIVRLQPAGELVWLELAEPMTHPELGHRTADVLQPEELVAAVDGLARAGVVVVAADR